MSKVKDKEILKELAKWLDKHIEDEFATFYQDELLRIVATKKLKKKNDKKRSNKSN